LRSGAGSAFHVDGRATAKLRGPLWTVLVNGMGSTPPSSPLVLQYKRRGPVGRMSHGDESWLGFTVSVGVTVRDFRDI